MIPNRIVFIGSSTVYGCFDDESGGFVNRFRLWLEKQGSRSFVYSLGIFGETIEGLTERVEFEAPKRKPKFMFLYPGLNDTRCEGPSEQNHVMSLEEYENQIRNLLQKAKTLCKTAVIGNFPIDDTRTTPYKKTNAYYYSSNAELYMNHLRKICTEEEVPFLDIMSLWKDREKSSFLHEDGLHCNAAGHQMLFEELVNFLS